MLDETESTKFIANDAEEALLGCVLLDPEVFELIRSKIGNPEKLFSNTQNATIYKAMEELSSEGKGLDLITLSSELRSKDLVRKAGGLSRVSSLELKTPSAANASYYIDILFESMKWRELQKVGQLQSLQNIESYEGSSDQFIEEVSSKLNELSNLKRKESNAIKEQSRAALKIIERTLESKGVAGLSTGYRRFDKMIDGLRSGDLVIIAARPSIGKTSFAMNIAENLAIDLKQPTLVFSLEMTAESLIARMAYSRSGVAKSDVRNGTVSESDLIKIGNVINMIAASRLIIEDRGVSRLEAIISRTRALVKERGVKAVVVDYIQIVQAAGKSRNEEVGKISSELKRLAKDLGITVIALSQLSRDSEKQGNRKPRLSDLRDSGSIEQDADVVLFLHNSEGTSNPGMNNLEGIIAKCRDGSTGSVEFKLNKNITRFYEQSLINDNEIPE